MDANKENLLNFLGQNLQLNIPIYQRKYNWTTNESKQLFDDILKVGGSNDDKNHFIGSIVYMKKDSHISGPISNLMIIDGQQRLTTITLLISALVNFLKENYNENLMSPENIISYYLLNDREKGEKRYKLILTEADKTSLIKIIDNLTSEDKIDFNEKDSQRITENYTYFLKKINEDNVETIFLGLSKLIIIYVALEQGIDNPQLIFESLNSTGLELNQADLIRNFILIGLAPEEQEKLYITYWHEMEKIFEKDDKDLFDKFIRDYLTIHLDKIPTFKNIYPEFKLYSKKFDNVEKLVKDVYKYSQYFLKIAKGGEEDKELQRAFETLNFMQYDVIRPFTLNLYHDYAEDKLSKEEFIEILNLTESYLLRRLICGILPSSLSKTFASIYNELDPENYLESYKIAILLKDSYKRMPKNTEFINNFTSRDIYNLKSKNSNYILSKFENWDSKELTNIGNYTVEHIMPQNPNLSKAWKEELGPNWKYIQKNYLHTIGNITLTGYNSEMSDKPFIEKRDMKGGFKQSAIKLNVYLHDLEKWDQTAIEKRTKHLMDLAIKIWPYPKVDNEKLKEFENKKIDNKEYFIEDFKHLQENSPMKPLFDKLANEILAIDEEIVEEFTKLYVAFKLATNFVDIIPMKNNLKLILRIPYSKINDPENRCRNTERIGTWGNGDAELKINSFNDLKYSLNIIKQSYDYVKENW